ncbi:hypothetical protein ACHRVZ_17035 [Flavobacterium sp. FlaQc-57]|uniref:hypothetical protein n=1 Tax=Flavobacterium sp. FlaQc-57 TaxID=3374186 RepID=UPI00375778B0
MTEKILSKRWIYFVMAFVLIIFQRGYRLILNFPFVLNISLFLLCFLIILVFLYQYNQKEKDKNNLTKKNHKIYDKVDLFIDLLGCLIFAFFIFITIKVAVNFYLESTANDLPTQEIKLPIDNYISGRSDLLYYHFEDKGYSLGYSNPDHLTRKEIIEHYVLNIKYSKSILDMYVIKEYNIEIK